MKDSELFNHLEKVAKENELSIEIKINKPCEEDTWIYIYSSKYSCGELISLEELLDIENFKFERRSKKAKISNAIFRMHHLDGLSKEDIKAGLEDALNDIPTI